MSDNKQQLIQLLKEKVERLAAEIESTKKMIARLEGAKSDQSNNPITPRKPFSTHGTR